MHDATAWLCAADEWLERDYRLITDSTSRNGGMNPYEREVAHLRHVISTAKIVVTLTVGIAATFVAAELQVNQQTLGKRRPRYS